MGIACSMSRILQQGCATPVVLDPDPRVPDPCVAAHRDSLHPMTLIVDEPPVAWVMPLTIDWGDGHISSSDDGADAHGYAVAGSYTVTVSDAESRTCVIVIDVPG